MLCGGTMIKIEWIDSGREPKVAPNPKCPDGIDVDISTPPGGWNCRVELPYPARRIGHYLLECDICGSRVAITTAGRRDDPRSATIPCKRKSHAEQRSNDRPG